MIPNHIIKSQIIQQIAFLWNLFVCWKFYAFLTSIIFQKISVIQYLCIPLFQHLFLGHALLIRLSGSLSVLLSSFSYTVDIMLIPPPLGHIFPIKIEGELVCTGIFSIFRLKRHFSLSKNRSKRKGGINWRGVNIISTAVVKKST